MKEAPLSNHPHVEMVPLASLRADPNNPRKHEPKQIRQIADAIERFGFLVPIVADDEGLIAAGHGRYAAARLLKLDEVPTIRARFLSEVDRRAFALAENRLSDLSTFDDVKLSAELQYLFEAEFNIELTGFSASDLDLSIAPTEGEEEPVELPGQDSQPVSRAGDLWHIGPHRLFCGNAREIGSFETVLGNERANLAFADPPYNVAIAGNVSGLGKVVHRDFAEASGEMSPVEFTAFLRTVFRNCVRFSTDGSIHYHCMDWRHMREMLDASEGVYGELKQLAVWHKTAAGMGSFYRSQHELIFIFKSGIGRHINNFGLGKRHRTNVWTYPGANTFHKGRDADLADHPTVKPVAMVADAILDCSQRGDTVLDPFSGSGTTLVAAHRTGRRGAAIELDPRYVDVSLRRIAAATGIEPMLSDGRTFAQVAADRAGEVDHG